MLSFDPKAAEQKVPVIVVCGVDGQSRTTAVESILASSGSMQWVVISNETEGPQFASAATERVAGQMVPHAIGCLCCVTRSGLVSSLRRLFALRSQGQIDFSRVIIETLPDYDPAPVIQTLLNNALVTEYFRLDSVVTAMPKGGFAGLAGSVYGFKQLAMSDRIILGSDGSHDISRLTHLSPGADLLDLESPDLSEAVVGAGLESCLLSEDLSAWLANTSYAASDSLENRLHGFAVKIEEPLAWDTFHAWLNAGTQMNGDIMFRTKGVLRIEGMDGAVAVNGAQHVYQPPQVLPGIAVKTSTLLMVTEDLDRSAVAQSLKEDLPEFAKINAARADRAARAALDPSIPL